MAYFFPVILFILFFYFPVSGNAQLLPGPGPSLLSAPDFRIWSPDGSGGWNINYGSKSTGGAVSGNAQVLSGGTQLRHHNLWDIPSSNGKSYRVPLSHTSVVDVSKVGSRLGSLARLLSPVGMAIGTAAYICTETNICDNAGEWFFNEQQTIPSDNDLGWCYGGTLTFKACIEQSGPCGYGYLGGPLNRKCSDGVKLSSSSWSFKVYDSLNQFISTITVTRSSPWTPSGEFRPLEQSDWDAAESALNQPASTEHIINNGGTVPADSSSPPSLDGAPVSQPIGTTTTTLYDANNNATGTQTKETTLTITDGATLDAPNQITYNETTVINNYDLSNNLIDRTVVDTSAPPPAPPEIGDIEIEFDSVSENELEEYETPDMDDWTSWGSGSCPPPISINTNHWNGVLDTQPMCDFAEGINPFVLLFAALISAYIVAGIRTSGH